MLFRKWCTDWGGTYQDKLIVSTKEKKQGNFIYNAEKGKVEKDIPVPWNLPRIKYYQNGEVISEDYQSELYNIVLWNPETKRKTMLEETSQYLFDISPDKLHVLVGVPDKLLVVNVQSKQVVGIISWPIAIIRHEYNPVFLSNTLVSFNIQDFRNVYSLNGDHLAKVSLKAPGISQIGSTVLGNDLKYAFLHEKVGSEISSHYLVDLKPLSDYFDKNNLLFYSTTATATESQVRVRENPNLEAHVFGALSKGDTLDVLDRSGIKVKVGELTDWWYKVKRKSDSLTGWAYGAFLKLYSYQGELGPKPVVDER